MDVREIERNEAIIHRRGDNMGSDISRSTVSMREFVKDHFFFGGMSGIALFNLVPTICPIAQYNQNVLVLIACMIVTSGLGVLLTYRNNRTYWGVIEDLCSGLGLYVLIVLGPYKVIFVQALIGLFIIITAIGVIALFKTKIRNQSVRKQVIRARIHKSLLRAKRNIALVCAISMIVIPIAVHFTPEKDIINTFFQVSGRGTTSTDSDYSMIETYDDSYSLSNNIDTIKAIRHNDTFQKLDYEGKCQVVEALVHCEARYLGLPKFELKFKELKDGILAQYVPKTKTIEINSKPLKDGSMPGGTNEEVLKSITHECRHAYQWSMRDLYIKATPEQRALYVFTNENVSDWVENSIFYEGSDGDKGKYKTQAVEIDAQNWAGTAVIRYSYNIDRLCDKRDDEELKKFNK